MSAERVAMIRQRLESVLSLDSLEVIDESHLHIGHAGARDGRGHFRVRVVSNDFLGLPRLARHRKVYAAMGELMTTDIHALNIEALTADES
ncbi:BolA family protein [Wenzhouxiangella limi]|uniref:BolA family transcriptional regulator n=1 Tax=Wenzhouxiangella limi TaxID=2707351 RepID=A0A845UXZ4_9GAMM|nr:BolA family protein [Wenzhouxiangella limi]NDY94740.1 BolA family transcriptional regulator [Wenzhouxiangella limi]